MWIKICFFHDTMRGGHIYSSNAKIKKNVPIKNTDGFPSLEQVKSV